MTKNATKLMQLVEDRSNLIKSINTQQTSLTKLTKEINNICHHPILIDKSSYSEGGYDYRSVSRKWEECTLCGKHFNSKETYGGFA